jgi:predicted  nucleic acid-binding Zn ribbon protein
MKSALSHLKYLEVDRVIEQTQANQFHYMGAEMFNPVVARACCGFQMEWMLKEHIFHILKFIYLQFYV